MLEVGPFKIKHTFPSRKNRSLKQRHCRHDQDITQNVTAVFTSDVKQDLTLELTPDITPDLSQKLTPDISQKLTPDLTQDITRT